MRPALEFYFYADSPAARQTKGTAVAIRHYQIPSDTNVRLIDGLILLASITGYDR